VNPQIRQVKRVCEANPIAMLAQPELIKSYYVQNSCPVFDDSGGAAATSSGRPAVEQVDGYMCWNSQVYRILTTATSSVFLSREDDGHLWISQMFPRYLQPTKILQ